tara:strand:- start:5877 stop:6482 length:606 start_codon:yes stop_codon:yes gene_type:complete
MLSSLYNKCLNLAGHKKSNLFLGIVSFIESSFFPIPPDIMIVPMVIAKRKDYLKIFWVASLFSVFGGIFGYMLGAIFIDVAMNIINLYGYEDKVSSLKTSLNSGQGFLAWLSILFLAGFTPLPYKVFTIASGLISFNLFIFILISFISRGLRFFIISYLSYKFGYLFSKFMNKYGSRSFTAIGLLLILIFFIIVFILKFNA